MEPNEESPDLASYARDSPFVRLLGKPGRVKILDVLLRKHYTELTASQITDLAGVSPSTFSRNKDELLDLGIIREAGDVGGTTVYTLNTESELAQVLRDAQNKLFEHTSRINVTTDPEGLSSEYEAYLEAYLQRRESKRDSDDPDRSDETERAVKDLARDQSDIGLLAGSS